jgi:hypothetical protein
MGKKLLLSEFNFHGFSHSKGWVGYFERNKSFEIKFVDLAIKAFNVFFRDEMDNFFVMTALCRQQGTEKDAEILHEYNDIFLEMKKEGVIKDQDESMVAYFSDARPLPCENIQFNDYRLIEKLSKLVMAHGDVRGELCFFINLDLNIAIYPHNDTGYGAIGLNGDASCAIRFLKYCREYTDFDVHIKPKFRSY